MDVLRHDNESMQCVSSLIAVVEEGFEQEVRVAGDLEQRSSVCRDRSDGVGVARELHDWLRKAYLRG